MTSPAKHKLLLVVMDGIGVRHDRLGNAVELACTPNLRHLMSLPLYRTLAAHGKAVGMPSDADMGNSEVGHNAIGAGQVYDQGAKLVQNAIADGSLFRGATWQTAVKTVKAAHSTLHFIGLLSDGNVHSHEDHLYAMLRHAAKDGVKRMRVHVLFDGRDVGERTAEVYAMRLEAVLTELRASGVDAAAASGGGRMSVTMDRYEADWRIVERGWQAHVLGQAELKFPSLMAAVSYFRQKPELTDQYFPSFVITDVTTQVPVGTIQDNDAVILYNFRGDRAIEISRAFTEPSFHKFTRGRFPKVFFAGMMQYDGDLHIPDHFLVAPPLIKNTLSEYFVSKGLRQFACSETQKFGHVTYFWNGNRTGKFSEALETYVEIPSDLVPFDQKPWMKAYEITEETIKRMATGSFDFGRINYANGDMVGHTGHLAAAITAVNVVDLMLGRLMDAAVAYGYTLVVTADHGNADEMYELTGKEKEPVDPSALKAKTSHTLNPVPFAIWNSPLQSHLSWAKREGGGLGNIAATVCDLMGVPSSIHFLPSLLQKDL